MALIGGVDVAGKIRECAALVGADLGVDPDEIHLQVAIVVAELDRTTIYDELALALNLGMLADDARARYREIWGKEWTEILPLAGEHFDGLAPSGTTTAATIIGSPHARRSR